MTEPTHWAELRQLSLNVAASHIAIVAFLEEAVVPWSDEQMAEFEQLILAERVALSAYAAFVVDPGRCPAATGSKPECWSGRGGRLLAVPAGAASRARPTW